MVLDKCMEWSKQLNTFLLCEFRGRVTHYIRESRRTLYERMLENDQDNMYRSEASHMYQKVSTEHQTKVRDMGLKGQEKEIFQVRVIMRNKTSFIPQLQAYSIKRSTSTILNCKLVYNLCLLPGITKL